MTGALELARAARWTFPSSTGKPALGDEPWLAPLLAEQSSLPEVARSLDAGDATELAARTWRLWMLNRDVDGGRAFVGEVLARQGGRAVDRSIALYGSGLFAFWQGAYDESLALNEQALAAAREAEDSEGLALANLGLSRALLAAGDPETARARAVEARRHAAGAEPLGQAPLHLHAQSVRMLGDYDCAAELFRESLALNRWIGDRGMVAVELHNLGWVELHRENTAESQRLFSELAALESDTDPYSFALRRLNDAASAFGRGHRDEARALLQGAEDRLRATDTRLMTDDASELEWLRAELS